MPGYHLPCFAAGCQSGAKSSLELEIVEPEPGPANVRAVAQGQYDFCLTSVAHFLRAKQADEDLPVRFVFIVARRTHMAAFVVEGRPAAHCRPIESLAELGGATLLGARDSAFVREYLSLLARLGIEPGILVEMPYERVMEALATGEGDVAADYLDLLPSFQAAADPLAARVRALSFADYVASLYGSGLVTSESAISRNPQLVQNMVELLREALLRTRRSPELGLEAMLARLPEVDPHVALAGWEVGSELVFADGEERLGQMDRQTWARTIEFHAEAHGTPRFDPGSVFDASFVSPETEGRAGATSGAAPA
jgi:ABC-type nitrate/sulfonate/bicarbonate transport system substrate-binding protein